MIQFCVLHAFTGVYLFVINTMLRLPALPSRHAPQVLSASSSHAFALSLCLRPPTTGRSHRAGRGRGHQCLIRVPRPDDGRLRDHQCDLEVAATAGRVRSGGELEHARRPDHSPRRALR